MTFVGHRIVHHLGVSNICRALCISFAAACAGLAEDATPSQSTAHSSSPVAVVTIRVSAVASSVSGLSSSALTVRSVASSSLSVSSGQCPRKLCLSCRYETLIFVPFELRDN